MKRAPERGIALVVDDDRAVHHACRLVLEEQGYEVVVATSGTEGLRCAMENDLDLAMLDIGLPDFDGVELLRRMRSVGGGSVPVLMITGYGTVESAVEAMKLGAADYIEKPLNMDGLARAVEEMTRDRRRIAQAGSTDWALQQGLIGNSAAMARVLELIQRVANNDATVLIYGESGTGKELAARAIHEIGARRDEPFIPVDCSTLAAGVVESELFGHTKGAFTGADVAREGLLRLAGCGTAFLDEILDLSLDVQAKLLRALQEKTVRPVGSGEVYSINARVIASSNKDLMAAVNEGLFREDLFYRLHVVPIQLPPLRERREDIPDLAEHFLAKHSPEGRSPMSISRDAMEALRGFNWPGNVRQLENTIRGAVVLCDEPEIRAWHLPGFLSDVASRFSSDAAYPRAGLMQRTEKAAIIEALQRSSGNKRRACLILGISKSTLYRKLRKYRIGELA